MHSLLMHSFCQNETIPGKLYQDHRRKYDNAACDLPGCQCLISSQKSDLIGDHPEIVAMTDSRLMISAATVGFSPFWPTICKV